MHGAEIHRFTTVLETNAQPDGGWEVVTRDGTVYADGRCEYFASLSDAERRGIFESAQETLQSQLTLPAAIGLLIFFVFALQCISTVAVMRRETNGWKWPILQFSYMLALAYLGALAAYQLF